MPAGVRFYIYSSQVNYKRLVGHCWWCSNCTAGGILRGNKSKIRHFIHYLFISCYSLFISPSLLCHLRSVPLHFHSFFYLLPFTPQYRHHLLRRLTLLTLILTLIIRII